VACSWILRLRKAGSGGAGRHPRGGRGRVGEARIGIAAQVLGKTAHTAGEAGVVGVFGCHGVVGETRVLLKTSSARNTRRHPSRDVVRNGCCWERLMAVTSSADLAGGIAARIRSETIRLRNGANAPPCRPRRASFARNQVSKSNHRGPRGRAITPMARGGSRGSFFLVGRPAFLGPARPRGAVPEAHIMMILIAAAIDGKRRIWPAEQPRKVVVDLGRFLEADGPSAPTRPPPIRSRGQVARSSCDPARSLFRGPRDGSTPTPRGLMQG